MSSIRALAAVVLAAAAAPAAAFAVIGMPNAAYRAGTTPLPIPDGPAAVTTISDPRLAVVFSVPLLPLDVPSGWSTWASPPQTESGSPRVLWTQWVNRLVLSFSVPITAWGFEAQPAPFAPYEVTVDFFGGGALLGSITHTVDGRGGARLFAATAGPGEAFTRVVVRSEASFALAQLRYGGIIPEPASWALMIAGFGLVGCALRRRRGRVPAQV